MAGLHQKYVQHDKSTEIAIDTESGAESLGNDNSIVSTRSSKEPPKPHSVSVDSRSRCCEQVIEMTVPEEKKRENPTKLDDKKFKKGPRPAPPPGLKDDLTTIAHICVVLYTGLILYLCFSRPFEFFTWHPLLLSIGWMLLLTEGVLFISKENPIGRRLRLNHTLKLRYHWIAVTISLVLVAIGFIVIIINKNNKNKEHFKTWHAIFGLIALIGCVPAVLNGIAALFDVELKNYIKPALNKAIHVASGKLSVIFGGLALILGVYTNWFVKASGNNKYLFLLGFITSLYVTVWTVQRPMRKTLRKFFKFENV